MSEPSGNEKNAAADFERRAAESGARGPVKEFWYFLSSTGKWWMLPIIVSLLGVGALIIVGGTAAAPLIYALF